MRWRCGKKVKNKDLEKDKVGQRKARKGRGSLSIGPLDALSKCGYFTWV